MQKKTAYAVRNVKMRSDPRSQFWYAAIGGHFCSFLVSNIFCDPLFLLSICLPYSSHRSNTNHTFLNGEYRGFWVLLLRAERRGLYFVASAAVRCRFTPMPSVFRTVRIACLSITQLTSHTLDHRSRINDLSDSTAEFCGYPYLPWNRRGTRIYRLALQSGVTQAYMGLLLLHLNFKKNFVGVVHRGNPPSPQVSYGVGLRCSLDCTSLGLRLYYSTRFGVWQLANCQKYKIIFCLQGRFCV